MNITSTRPVAAIERVSIPGRTAAETPSAELGAGSAALIARASIDTARRNTAARRGGKLAKLETQVRQGDYKPDAPAIAREILADAETRAGLSALLAH